MALPTATKEDARSIPAGADADNYLTAAELNEMITDARGGNSKVVNVAHYGSNAAAFQSALDAGAGGTVLVPPGTYSVSTTLFVSAGTTLRAVGPGAAVLNFSGTPDAAANSAIRLAGAGAAVEGLEINVTGGAYRKTIEVKGSRCAIRNNKINVTSPDVGGLSHYIILAGVDAANPVEHVTIEGNDITASGLLVSDAIQAIYCPGIKVVGNYVHDISSVGSDYHNWGIYISQQSNGSLVALNRLESLTNLGGIHVNDDPGEGGTGVNYGARVLGNSIESVTFVGISVDYCVGALVHGNFVRDTGMGIKIIDGRANRVIGNHVEYQHTLASALSAAYPYVETDSTAAGVVIANNTFGPKGTAGAIGVNVYGPDVQVIGNRFQTDGCGQAIYVASTVLQGIISQNLIPAPTAATTTVIRTDSENILIDGNFVGFPAATSGIRVAASNCQVSNNRVTGAGNNAIHVSAGTSSVVRGNILTSAANGINNAGTTTVLRDNVSGGKPLQASGRATFSGDGATTLFNITHNMAQTPTSEIVTPATDDARILLRTSRTGTLIQVVFATPPIVGVNNVVLNWYAEVS